MRKKVSKKKLLHMKPKNKNGHRITILAKLKRQFNEENKAEPFVDQDYVAETNRLFDLLMEEYPHDPTDSKDRAIYDIVADIFRVCGKEVE